MNTVLKVLAVIGVTFIGLFIVFVILVQRSCTSSKYFAIRDAKAFLFRVDGRDLQYDSVYDYQKKLDHVDTLDYHVLRPDSVWNDSAQFGILIDFDVTHCDDCSSFMDANAATEPGIWGTQQRIKSMRISVSNNEGRLLNDITDKLNNDSLCDCIRLVSFKSAVYYFDSKINCDKKNRRYVPVPDLAAFRDTFNTNHFRGGIPRLMYLVPPDEIRSFPEEFKLKLELIFEGGYTVHATARGRHVPR